MILKMKNEKEKVYIIEPLFEHFNENHQLKPYGYQHLINSLANEHLKDTNQGVGTLLLGKYAWVLVSMSFEVLKEIKDVGKYFGKTWFSGRRGPYYRREFIFTDSDNNIHLKGASHSILMDLTDRSVYRQKQLPFKSFPENKEYLIKSEPRLKETYSLKNDKPSRKVLNSHLDPIGHVNNLRYTEFVYDEFSHTLINEINNIKRYDLYFQNELKINDEFVVVENAENNKIIYEIFNTKTNKKAFSLVFTLIKESNAIF